MNKHFYQLVNNDSEKNVLFIHGYNASHQTILPLKNIIKSFNLYAIDLPCHNGNPCLVKNNIENFAKYIIQQLNQTNIKEWILIGHSLGGAVALAINAIKNKTMTITKNILVAPFNPFYYKYNFEHYKLLHPNNDQEAYRSLELLVRNMDKTIYFKNINKSVKRFLKNVKSHHEDLKYLLNKEILNKDFQQTTLFSWYENAKNKTEIISGKEDVFVNFQTIKEVHQIFGIKIHPISNCGHGPFFEQTNEITKLLEKII